MTDLASELRDIERKLFEIPDEKVAQLTLLIERSRALVLSVAVANAALGTLRPRLVKTRPPRYLTLQRVFCHPFEDLLVMGEEGVKPFGRISRSSLAPCWEFVLSCLDAAAVKQLEASLRASPAPDIGSGQDPRIPRLGATLWKVASQRLREELSLAAANADHRAALVDKLGSEAALGDLTDMTCLLELAPEAEKLREAMSPKPVGRLLDEQVEEIKQVYTDVAASGKGMPGCLIAVVVARLTDGFQALPIFDSLGELPTGIEGMKPGQYVRAMLSGDSKRFFGAVTRTDPAKVDDAKVADMVGDFVSLIGRLKKDGMAEGPQPEMDAASRQLKDMVRIGVLGGIDEKVLGGIDAVLSLPAAEEGEEAKKAVFDAKLEAENRVYALQRVARVATEIGADKDVSGAIKQLTGQIDNTGNTLLADIKAGKLNGEGPEAARTKLFAAVRMLELVAGSQYANKLMKDGMAAIARMPQA